MFRFEPLHEDALDLMVVEVNMSTQGIKNQL
jgi:hypothetical protein